MNELLAEVKKAAQAEYNRASAVNGPTFNSLHEAYAVILEEVEEAEESGEHARSELSIFWDGIRGNDLRTGDHIEDLFTSAIHAAAEYIQVAAMCHKALQPKASATEPVIELHPHDDKYDYDGQED